MPIILAKNSQALGVPNGAHDTPAPPEPLRVYSLLDPIKPPVIVP